MSFWKNLFGGGTRDTGPDTPTAETEHKGYSIRATPFSEGGQFQTSGVISREIDGSTREHRFIRADRFPSIEDATAHSLRKGIQLVDEQGDRIFDTSH